MTDVNDTHLQTHSSPNQSPKSQGLLITTGPHCSLPTMTCSHNLRTAVEPRDPSVSVMVVPLGHLGEDVGSQVLRKADPQYLQDLEKTAVYLFI